MAYSLTTCVFSRGGDVLTVSLRDGVHVSFNGADAQSISIEGLVS